jgi:tetratricopeptide (TPR) repeat protein
LISTPIFFALLLAYTSLEAATGHYEEALLYYNRAVEIRLAIGDRAAIQLGTTYLGIGRCQAYYKKYNEARRMFAQAEQLFVRTVGADKYFMAKCVLPFTSHPNSSENSVRS